MVALLYDDLLLFRSFREPPQFRLHIYVIEPNSGSLCFFAVVYIFSLFTFVFSKRSDTVIKAITLVMGVVVAVVVLIVVAVFVVVLNFDILLVDLRLLPVVVVDFVSDDDLDVQR